jgi:hypothetical protein
MLVRGGGRGELILSEFKIHIHLMYRTNIPDWQLFKRDIMNCRRGKSLAVTPRLYSR